MITYLATLAEIKMYSGGGYNFGNYDPRTGKEPSKVVGKQSSGNLTLKYLYNDEDDGHFPDDTEYDEEVNINKKIVNSLPMQASDPYSIADRSAGQTKNTGGLGLVMEFDGDHKNPIRHGISPYAQSKHSGGAIGTGGASQAFKTTGNYRRTGTHRPHGHMAVQPEESIFNLSDFLDEDLDPDISNFKRQQNRVKKVLKAINE